MKTLNLKLIAFTIICFVSASSLCGAQQGSVSVNQDKKIAALLDLRKEMNKTDSDSDRYKIQIYSGNRAGSNSTLKEFNESFSDLYSTDTYEEPNYKVWIGNFRTRLEADRALKTIKIKYPNAFIFKPKK